MYRRIAILIVGVMLACGACGTSNGHPVLNGGAKSAKEALPAKVAHLLTHWPDESVLSSDKRMMGDENRHVRSAKDGSIGWIKKILNPEWLPSEKGYFENHLIMIRNEFGEFDVVRVEWTKNGYQLQVSQTAGITAIKLMPLDQREMGETVQQRIELAKKLCGQIMNDTGMRYGIHRVVSDKGKALTKSVKVSVKGLSAKICDYSFRPRLVREFPDAIVGVAATMEDEGLPRKRQDSADVAHELREDNPDWDKSASSWGYWWRHVSWWHDGKSIGFFTLTTEGGAWSANYRDNMGANWFEGTRWKPPK